MVEGTAQEWCCGGDPAEAANELVSREGAVATAVVLDVVGRQNGLMDRWFRMDRIQRQGAQTRRLKQRRAILKRDDAQRQSRVAELVARENKSPREHQEHWQDRASALQQQLMDATRDLAARRSKRRQRGGDRYRVRRVVEERGLATLQPVRMQSMPRLKASSQLSSRRLRSVGGQ